MGTTTSNQRHSGLLSMQPSTASTPSYADDGLVAHAGGALLVGAAAAFLIHFVAFDGVEWTPESVANLRAFASTAAQIAGGLAALMFAGLALQLAVPASSALGMLRRSGHFYGLARRMCYAMLFWLALAAGGLFVMLISAPAPWHQVMLMGAGVAGLVSTVDAMRKLLKLVWFSAQEFDPDYSD